MASPPLLLVVDDEPFVMKIAQRVLQRDGIDVLCATTGGEALSILAANPDISLILLDASLTDMNAEQVLSLMRDHGFSTPVLLSSGFGVEYVPTAEHFANVCGFLPKPYPVARLSAQVRELLQLSRSAQT